MYFLFSFLAQRDAAQGAVNLEVPIGNLVRASSIAEYIAALFKYGVSIAGLIATVVVVIGGMQWLLAAGDSSKIKQAKDRIAGAIIGLVLVLATTLILNTINPEILKLRNLYIPKVQTTTLSGAAGNLYLEPCYTIRDAAACRASCPPGQNCECRVVEGTFWSDAAEIVNTLGPIAFSGGLAAVENPALITQVGSLAKRGVASAGRASWKTLTWISKNPTLAAGGAAALVISSVGSGDGELGICVPIAADVPPGGLCDPRLGERNCIAGSTCQEFSEGLGYCTRGEAGDFCNPDSERPRNGCNEGLSCVESLGGFSQCTGGSGTRGKGEPCETSAQCARGGGLYCVPRSSGSNECRFGTEKDYTDPQKRECVTVGENRDAQCRTGLGYFCYTSDREGYGPYRQSIQDAVARCQRDKAVGGDPNECRRENTCRKDSSQTCTNDDECLVRCGADGRCRNS